MQTTVSTVGALFIAIICPGCGRSPLGVASSVDAGGVPRDGSVRDAIPGDAPAVARDTSSDRPDADGALDSRGTGDVVATWRESRAALCVGTGPYPTVADVWSDSRGVFLLAAEDSRPATIRKNLGKVWETSYAWPPGTVQMTGGLKGFQGGPLVVYGGSPYGIQLVDDQGAHVSGAGGGSDVAVVGPELAYAIYSDRVLRFDGAFWTQLGSPLPPAGQVNTRALWADSSVLVVAADAGRVFVIRPDRPPVLQTGLPETDFTAVWGFGADDLWLGSADGQLFHYDGTRWTPKATLQGDCVGIRKLWGSEGELFVLSRSLFAKWDGSRIEVLASLPCDDTAEFQGLWGNSRREVFISLVDRSQAAPGCGPIQVRWYDGASVSPF